MCRVLNQGKAEPDAAAGDAAGAAGLAGRHHAARLDAAAGQLPGHIVAAAVDDVVAHAGRDAAGGIRTDEELIASGMCFLRCSGVDV